MQEFTTAAAVKKARKDRGWSQGQLASRSGADRSTISRIENGHTPNPGHETLGKIAVALEVPIAQLTGEQATLETSVDTLTELSNVLKYKPALARKALKIFLGYNRADAANRQWIERLLDVLADQGEVLEQHVPAPSIGATITGWLERRGMTRETFLHLVGPLYQKSIELILDDDKAPLGLHAISIAAALASPPDARHRSPDQELMHRIYQELSAFIDDMPLHEWKQSDPGKSTTSQRRSRKEFIS